MRRPYPALAGNLALTLVAAAAPASAFVLNVNVASRSRLLPTRSPRGASDGMLAEADAAAATASQPTAAM